MKKQLSNRKIRFAAGLVSLSAGLILRETQIVKQAPHTAPLAPVAVAAQLSDPTSPLSAPLRLASAQAIIGTLKGGQRPAASAGTESSPDEEPIAAAAAAPSASTGSVAVGSTATNEDAASTPAGESETPSPGPTINSDAGLPPAADGQPRGTTSPDDPTTEMSVTAAAPTALLPEGFTSARLLAPILVATGVGLAGRTTIIAAPMPITTAVSAVPAGPTIAGASAAVTSGPAAATLAAPPASAAPPNSLDGATVPALPGAEP